MAASSRKRTRSLGGALQRVLLAALLGCFAGCSNGVGDGQVTATLTVDDCGLAASPYTLNPTFFAADSAADFVEIRVQRGGDWELASDGIGIGVADATLVEASMLGTPIAFEPSAPHTPATTPVTMSLYLNSRCPLGPRDQPVVLVAVSGTVTFDSLWVPDGDTRKIIATLSNVRLEDPNAPSERFALLDGWFDFYYTRGLPAQRYP